MHDGGAALDGLSRSATIAALAPLFEAAPRFLARLVAARPFGTWERLFERARVIAHAMPEPEQVELANAHPRLGAPRETVSALSAREQGYDAAPLGPAAPLAPAAPPPPRAPAAPLAPAAPPSPPGLARLNDAYEARFGFRYCVFVAGRPLAALVPELEAALRRDRTVELHRALDAVIDIAVSRHAAARIVAHEASEARRP